MKPRYELQYLVMGVWTYSGYNESHRTLKDKKLIANRWNKMEPFKYRIVQLTETVVYPKKRKP